MDTTKVWIPDRSEVPAVEVVDSEAAAFGARMAEAARRDEIAKMESLR